MATLFALKVPVAPGSISQLYEVVFWICIPLTWNLSFKASWQWVSVLGPVITGTESTVIIFVSITLLSPRHPPSGVNVRVRSNCPLWSVAVVSVGWFVVSFDSAVPLATELPLNPATVHWIKPPDAAASSIIKLSPWQTDRSLPALAMGREVMATATVWVISSHGAAGTTWTVRDTVPKFLSSVVGV